MKRQVAVLCTALMLWLVAVSVAIPAQAADKGNIKEQVVSIPAGSVVEVKLLNKSKIKGRLGAIDDIGFELQSVQGGRLTNERVTFESVRSIKVSGDGMSTGAKVGLGALAGIGVLFLVVGLVCAATGCSN